MHIYRELEGLASFRDTTGTCPYSLFTFLSEPHRDAQHVRRAKSNANSFIRAWKFLEYKKQFRPCANIVSGQIFLCEDFFLFQYELFIARAQIRSSFYARDLLLVIWQ